MPRSFIFFYAVFISGITFKCHQPPLHHFYTSANFKGLQVFPVWFTECSYEDSEGSTFPLFKLPSPSPCAVEVGCVEEEANISPCVTGLSSFNRDLKGNSVVLRLKAMPSCSQNIKRQVPRVTRCQFGTIHTYKSLLSLFLCCCQQQLFLITYGYQID